MLANERLVELQLPADNLFEHFRVVLVIERWKTGKHFEEQDAKAVNVESTIVSVLSVEHLGAQVLGRPAEGVRLFILSDELGQTKVRDSDVAIHVDQYILRLDISVDYVLFVHVSEAEQNFAHVELGQFFGEAALLQQMEEEFATSTDIHDKEKLALALKGPVQLDDKRVLAEHLQDATFAQYRLSLTLDDQLIFLQYFNCV